jgi:predicted branched-subunit amino acid permease
MRSRSGTTAFRRGVRDTLALAAPVGVFGFVFGALAVQVGLAGWQAVLASVIVVSGAAQLALVTLLAAGPGAVLIAATGLALRHLPMSATMSHLIEPAPWWRRFHLGWILVDETFALTLHASRRGETDLISYKTGADVTLFSTWLLTTLAGVQVGARLDDAAADLQLVFPLVFMGMAISMLKDRRHTLTTVVAVATSLLAVTFLPPAWQVSTAALAAAAVGSRLR